MTSGVLQPDGTYCRTGPNCMRHGNLGVLATALQSVSGQTMPLIQGAGTSGHSIGSRVEDHIYQLLLGKPEVKNLYTAPGLLNELYEKNPAAVTSAARGALLGAAPRGYLFARGEVATKNWSAAKKFQVKQNDTADLILLSDTLSNIRQAQLTSLDVKSVQVSADGKRAQAPNIISSTKLFAATVPLVKEARQPDFNLIYTAVRWKQDLPTKQINFLDTRLVNLFKVPPKELYINWTAANQIQFHPETVSQAYDKDALTWCREYQQEFIANHAARLSKLQKAQARYLSQAGFA